MALEERFLHFVLLFSSSPNSCFLSNNLLGFSFSLGALKKGPFHFVEVAKDEVIPDYRKVIAGPQGVKAEQVIFYLPFAHVLSTASVQRAPTVRAAAALIASGQLKLRPMVLLAIFVLLATRTLQQQSGKHAKPTSFIDYRFSSKLTLPFDQKESLMRIRRSFENGPITSKLSRPNQHCQVSLRFGLWSNEASSQAHV